MTPGNVFFAICAIVCVSGALVTILARNPIRGAVGLLGTIIGIAGLFLQLRAQFLSAIQLIVYAGAVVVLFVFVIMLLGPDAGAVHGTGRARASRALAGTLLAALSIVAIVLLGAGATHPTPFGAVHLEHGTTEAVGGLLFRRGIVPFELATALLIVAVIGAIAVARGRPPKKREKASDSPTERMFHGPLHPRDAGHPLSRERLG